MPTQTSPRPRRDDDRSWPRRHKITTGLGALVVLGIIISAATSGGGSSPSSSSTSPAARSSSSAPAPATSAPASSPAANPAPKHVVEYVVTGSTADVTYGPIGSSYTGTVPMHKSVSLDSTDAIGYSISAQLQGSGSVDCAVVIDGKTISTAHADGGYNIAICEAVKDPFGGGYSDANKG